MVERMSCRKIKKKPRRVEPLQIVVDEPWQELVG